MGDLIRNIIMYAVIMAVIIACFKFLKLHNKVNIDSNDHSMDPVYTYGDYKLDATILKVSDLHTNDVVAYWVPGTSKLRVAKVMALEGQKIEANKSIKVDGQPTAQPIGRGDWGFPETKVPRGCVFVMAASPSQAEDSMTVGAIPFLSIKGRLPPP